jgi:hypothetical protein
MAGRVTRSSSKATPKAESPEVESKGAAKAKVTKKTANGTDKTTAAKRPPPVKDEDEPAAKKL